MVEADSGSVPDTSIVDCKYTRDSTTSGDCIELNSRDVLGKQANVWPIFTADGFSPVLYSMVT